MGKVSLFIATSLDGFIAAPDGTIDWLFTDGDYGYSAFIAGVDILLMGYKTYATLLGFGGEFPYPHTQNYVFSKNHRHTDSNPVIFTAEDPGEVTRRLKNEAGGTIWLVGGGQINGALLAADLIDEIVVSVHPIALGAGLPLFAGANYSCRRYRPVSAENFPSGLVQITYLRGSRE